MSKSNFINLFLLSLVLISAVLWWRMTDHNTAPAQPSSDPQLVMQDVTMVKFNLQGQVQYRLLSPRITYFTQNKSANVYQPHLIVAQNQQPPWNITAKVAHINNHFNKITLVNAVKLQQAATSKNPATVATTESITLYPKQKLAQTNKPVQMQQGDNTIAGTGMHADLNKGTIQLLSNVSGFYVPAK